MTNHKAEHAQIRARSLPLSGASVALELVERNASLKSRNIVVRGRRTSVRLEPAMWEALRDIAAAERSTINDIVSKVAECRTSAGSLTSAIRVFVMAYYRSRTPDLAA
ncbi:MAG TPA: ribbon-helix-helix domain-containing protein [Alphaproteobacteria bacterium]|nr:ribbon-helix-helix domain-containing protein [Alphaproteobacteria bacterium]